MGKKSKGGKKAKPKGSKNLKNDSMAAAAAASNKPVKRGPRGR